MIEESQQEQAALYASGALSASEREEFEATLGLQRGLPELVAELEEISAALVVATLPAQLPMPSAAVGARLFNQLRSRSREQSRETAVAGASR